MNSIKDLIIPVVKDKVIIGKITKKTGNRYIVQDKRSRNYSVRSVLSFNVGKTVIIKNGIILNTTNDLKDFKTFVV
jgi:hypothetical protein